MGISISHRRKLLSLLLLFLFLGHLGSVAPFTHTHYDSNGGSVTHSHPYTGTSGSPGHSHTALQFQTIAQLSLLLVVLASATMGLQLLPARTIVRNISCRCGTDRQSSHRLSLRGPPRPDFA